MEGPRSAAPVLLTRPLRRTHPPECCEPPRATSRKTEFPIVQLKRLGPHGDDVWVNPDLIATLEAHPDTVVVLTTGTKLVVADTIDEVVARVRAWRVSVARGALKPHESEPTTLA